jgi:hypothetical protein
VDDIGIKQTSHDSQAFAGMRVMRIPNNDFKWLFLGSMSRTGREQ